ncbi:MAG: multidrug efflux SMR transporter [Mailhella sp.]|nr:multidrug efflux SMR transporter [Mailhella sp.]
MAWVYLCLAGIFEMCWAVGMKLSHGFSHLGWTAFTAVTMALSIWLLALAMRTLPLGSSYAIWTGIGAVGTALVGIAFFHEAASLGRIVSLLLIIAGIVGLKLSHGA